MTAVARNPWTRTAHRTTLQYFGLTEDDLPLVSFDISKWHSPFTHVVNN